MNPKKTRSVGGLNRVTRKRKPIYKKRSQESTSTQKPQLKRLRIQKPTLGKVKQKEFKKIPQVSQSKINPTINGISLLKKNWFWLRYVWAIIFVAVSLVIFFNQQGKTTISLRPHHEFVAVDTEANFYKYPQQDQFGFSIIALTEEVEMPVIAEGIRDVYTKSQGELTVFNNYSSEPQRLLPETRFKSAGGKIFVLGNESVIVPGKKGTTPGSVDIMVYANESGPEYNIDITDFSIPGFKEAGLTEKFNGMYAVSKQQMSGGYRGTEKYVSEEQRSSLDQKLKKQLENRLQQRIALEKTDTILLVKNSQQIQYNDLAYSESETGGYAKLGGRILSLAVSSKDIQKYLKETIKIPDDLYIFDVVDINNIEPSIIEGNTFDYVDGSRIRLSILGEPLVKALVDIDTIKPRLRGYPKNDIVSYFDGISSIDRAEVKVYPFWQKNLSTDITKIHVTVE